MRWGCETVGGGGIYFQILGNRLLRVIWLLGPRKARYEKRNTGLDLSRCYISDKKNMNDGHWGDVLVNVDDGLSTLHCYREV